MFPDENGTMFSGCAILNERGLLGLPKDTPVFFYTVAGSAVSYTHLEAGTSIDLGTGINAIQMGLPTTPKNIVRIDSNCEEITMSAIPSLVQAASDEEFEAAKADLIAQLKDAGAEESVELWSNAWAEAKTTIEGMTK